MIIIEFDRDHPDNAAYYTPSQQVRDYRPDRVYVACTTHSLPLARGVVQRMRANMLDGKDLLEGRFHLPVEELHQLPPRRER